MEEGENRKGEELGSMITCVYCTGVVREPVQCVNKPCSKLFCKECAEKITKTKSKCPNRCSQDEFKFEELARNTKFFLNNCRFKCLYETKGCNVKLSSDEYGKHHEEQCSFISYKCECGEILKSHETNKHMVLCETYNGECPRCGEIMSFLVLVDHSLNCNSMPINRECKNCKKYFTSLELEAHEKECRINVIECKYCRTRFNKEDESKHTKEVCYEITCKYNPKNPKYF